MYYAFGSINLTPCFFSKLCINLCHFLWFVDGFTVRDDWILYRFVISDTLAYIRLVLHSVILLIFPIFLAQLMKVKGDEAMELEKDQLGPLNKQFKHDPSL